MTRTQAGPQCVRWPLQAAVAWVRLLTNGEQQAGGTSAHAAAVYCLHQGVRVFPPQPAHLQNGDTSSTYQPGLLPGLNESDVLIQTTRYLCVY